MVVRHILFSECEAFKLMEFMLRAEKFLPVKFDLVVSDPDPMKEDKPSSFIHGYLKVISEVGTDRFSSTVLSAVDFSDRVLEFLDGAAPDDLVCLMTTDEMLLAPVDEQKIEAAFQQEKMLFSFSLRLGKNITRNSMVGMDNVLIPLRESEDTMVWDWDKHYVDFSGPLSVHGHYFRVKEIRQMIRKLPKCYSYDQLEEELQVYMVFPKKLMAAFVQSKVVSIDPLLFGNDLFEVRKIANERLLADDPLPIPVPERHNELHFNPFQEILHKMHGWKKQRILFKFPARGRKQKLFDALGAYYEKMINKEDFQFLVSIDEDDEVLNTEEVKNMISSYVNAKVVVGPSMGKIGAVNRDMDQAAPWDIVVLISDDMMPKVKGFDMLIRKDMNAHFPDLDGVLWYNDGHQGDKLNTLCILGKKYYDRFGWIYYPAYKSLFADNDFMEISKRLGKVYYNSLCIIEHQHWAWGYGKMDDLYTKNETFIQDDHDLFQKRMTENFGLKTLIQS